VGAVGLTQIGVWLLVAAALLLYASGSGALAGMGFLAGLPLGLDTLVLFLALFITGYFLFGGLYAAVGAIASNEQEASQLQIPVTILAVIPILVVPIALNSPAGTSAVALSWVPFFTPVLFLVRYVLGTVAGWEIALVFALQILSVLLVAWLGGRIYRLGLLMTGKRPTLPELIRWVRHG
jgi:ABC-2 type transport system permease protein